MARGKHSNLASGQPQQLSHSLSQFLNSIVLTISYPREMVGWANPPKKATLSKCKAQVQTAVIVYEQWE